MANQPFAELLGSLPTGFSADVVNASWAYYSTQKTAVLPIDFNRTGELRPSLSLYRAALTELSV